MKLTVYGKSYDCVSASKSKDSVRIVDKDGNETIFGGISDLSDYVLEGGEWGVLKTPPTMEDLEKENALLKIKIAMQDEKHTLMENCLLEIGEIVYA